MAQNLFTRFFKLLWSSINITRLIVVNTLFLVILGIVLVMVFDDETTPIPSGSALVFHLDGQLVEQKREIDPIEALTGSDEDEPKELLLADVVKAIEHAGDDQRIKGLVLKPGRLVGGLSKLEDIGRAIEKFKESGKPVLAQGAWFDQKNYYLASFADDIQLNKGGTVAIQGFGSNKIYFKDALDKLKVKVHLFRVGKYKSFAESYTRNDMSPEAKEANQALLDDLWHAFTQTAAVNRGVDPAIFSLGIDEMLEELEQADGDVAKYALNSGLVDSLKTDVEMRAHLIETFGKAKDDPSEINGISLVNYAKQTKPKLPTMGGDQIAIVVAKGTILNGDQPAGNVGGFSTSKLLRQAREDSNVKAVVLRVDSPGGSAFASEQIRQEILALQKAGKPVVSSMGSLAASGGYWISASTDKIVAQPTTITGSIGIIGMITTFEDAADTIGVHADGVGTTEMATLSVLRPLPENIKKMIQRTLDKGYDDFIQLVAESRDMTSEQVNEIAQGRVWSGKAAKELGLVDELGDIDRAIEVAAEIAELDEYRTKVIGPELSPEQLFLQEIMNASAQWLPPVTQSPLKRLMKQVLEPLETSLQLDDPNHRYLLCTQCSVQF